MSIPKRLPHYLGQYEFWSFGASDLFGKWVAAVGLD